MEYSHGYPSATSSAKWKLTPTCSFSSSAMASRISIARPASGGYQPSYTPDPHGFGNSKPSTGFRAANPDDPIEKIRAFARQVEDYAEIYAQPVKPHLPAIGRFLIVVTFLEDSWRIMTQWGDQLWYLQRSVRSARVYSGIQPTPNLL